MFKYIKRKFMAFSDIFKDDNKFNEKNIVGFASFAVMSIFAGADIVTGIMGQDLPISDTIFNSFVIITLGSFGIDGAVKTFAKKDKSNDEEELG
jgi:hypothetical protein